MGSPPSVGFKPMPRDRCPVAKQAAVDRCSSTARRSRKSPGRPATADPGRASAQLPAGRAEVLRITAATKWRFPAATPTPRAGEQPTGKRAAAFPQYDLRGAPGAGSPGCGSSCHASPARSSAYARPPGCGHPDCGHPTAAKPGCGNPGCGSSRLRQTGRGPHRTGGPLRPPTLGPAWP